MAASSQDFTPRLILISPLIEEAQTFLALFDEAAQGGDIAATLLRLPASDERSLIKQAKSLVEAVQSHGGAAILAVEGEDSLDLAMVASRAGADGVHMRGEAAKVRALKERFKEERAVGVGHIRTRDDAMAFGEAGADFLLFGEPRPDGSLPALAQVLERASWWAEIFEPPCAAYAPTLADIPAVVATGVEFVALGEAVWAHPQGAKEAVALASRALSAEPAR